MNPVITRLVCGFALGLVASGCGDRCESIPFTGEVSIRDLALLEGPEQMQLQLTVENGHDEPIFVIDSIHRILVDDEEQSSVFYELRAYVPDVIHVFQCAFCYREIPARSACEVRRDTFRTLTSLGGELHVHETEQVELEMAWGFEPFDPPAEGLAMSAFNDWEASIEDGASTASTERTAADEVGSLPEETPPTECWTVYF